MATITLTNTVTKLASTNSKRTYKPRVKVVNYPQENNICGRCQMNYWANEWRKAGYDITINAGSKLAPTEFYCFKVENGYLNELVFTFIKD